MQACQGTKNNLPNAFLFYFYLFYFILLASPTHKNKDINKDINDAN